jgi:hypothetical protein
MMTTAIKIVLTCLSLMSIVSSACGGTSACDGDQRSKGCDELRLPALRGYQAPLSSSDDVDGVTRLSGQYRAEDESNLLVFVDMNSSGSLPSIVADSVHEVDGVEVQLTESGSNPSALFVHGGIAYQLSVLPAFNAPESDYTDLFLQLTREIIDGQ